MFHLHTVFILADLELQYVLDAKKEQRKRMYFMSEEGRSRRKKTITMLKGREFKESFTVYLSPTGVKDKLTSLDVQVRFMVPSGIFDQRSISSIKLK